MRENLCAEDGCFFWKKKGDEMSDPQQIQVHSQMGG